jgi:hypothetical protein
MNKVSRANSVESLKAKFAMSGEFDSEAYRSLILRPTDVVITPYGKSGTTWVQQIVHCLRTRGDMDFDDISRVVPWIEASASLGIDLEAEQLCDPRAYKSHLGWDEIPKGGLYVVPIRDPKDALFSVFKFMEGWYFEPGSIELDDYAREFFIKRRGYWNHLSSWWPHRKDGDVLLMAFEHMKRDLSLTIKHIANFIDIELDDELRVITEERASLAYMQRHKDKFDDLLMRELSERQACLPLGSDSSKVRTGKVGEHSQYLSTEISNQIDEIWKEEISSKFGIESYQVLIESLE